MSVLHVWNFVFWKPLDFCHVIFFWAKSYFFLVYEKNREAAYLFLTPGEGGGVRGDLGQNIY